MTYGRLFL